MSGAGGDFHTTYFPQPTFISSRKYLFHYYGSNYATLDFSHNSFHEVLIKGTVAGIWIAPGNGTMDLVSSLVIDQVGRMPELPGWIRDGAILGVQGGTDVVSSYHECLVSIRLVMHMIVALHTLFSSKTCIILSDL